MSFGWGAGDILTAIQLSKQLYDALTESTTEYNDFAAWLREVHTSLVLFQEFEILDEATSNPNQDNIYTAEEKSALRIVITPLKANIDRLFTTLKRNLRLGEKPEGASILDWWRRQGKKLEWRFLRSEEVQEQQKQVKDQLQLLNTNLSKRTWRNTAIALSRITDISERTDGDHNAAMNFAVDTNQKVTQIERRLLDLLSAIEKVVLASGTLPDLSPVQNNANPDLIETCSMYQWVEAQLPTPSSKPERMPHVPVKIASRTRAALQGWLERSHTPCLWVCDDAASRISEALVMTRRKEGLPVLHFRCERINSEGRFIEPEEVLANLSIVILHQLLGYIVRKELPLPSKLNIDAFQQVKKHPESSIQILQLVSSLLAAGHDESVQLIWVIDDFNRLDDGLKRKGDGELHTRALERLLTLVQADRSPGSATDFGVRQKSLITTKLEKKTVSLGTRCLTGDLERLRPTDRADPETIVLEDAIKGMLLKEKAGGCEDDLASA